MGQGPGQLKREKRSLPGRKFIEKFSYLTVLPQRGPVGSWEWTTNLTEL